MKSEIFAHTQQPLLKYFPRIHLHFIGRGFYFSELSLKIVIISQFLSAWGKRIITRKTVTISFWRFRGMLFFCFFSWDAGMFMVKLFLEPICGMCGFSLQASSGHVSQQCFINCLLLFPFIQIIISETLQVRLETLYGFYYIRI